MKEGNDVDYLLRHVAGGSGPWQVRFLVLAAAVSVPSYLPLFLHLLAAYTPAHRCRVPVCDSRGEVGDDGVVNSWMGFTLPDRKEAAGEFLTDGDPFDPCSHFEIIDPEGECAPENFDKNATVACQDYVFDRGVFPATFTTDHGLVCGEQYKRRFLGTLMMLGMLLGSVVAGYLGDRIGRRRTILIAIILIGPSVAAGALAPNYEIYAALRLLTCCCFPLIWVNNHALILECFTKEYRVPVLCFKDFLWPVNLIILGITGYFFRDWTHLHLVVGLMTMVALPAWWFMPDSIRWLAENRRKGEAFQTLNRIAVGNGRNLSDEEVKTIADVLDDIESSSVDEETGKTGLSFAHIFRHGFFATTLVLVLSWATINVGAYTLALNATRLSGDVFLNFVLAACGEIPAGVYLYVVLTRSRRLPNLAGSLWILGACCLTLAFLPKSYSTLVLMTYLLGKSSVGAAFQLVWLITSEIYPTNLRSQALGFCSTCSRVFGLVCPFVSNLAVVWKPLPMMVLGLPALLNGAAAYFLLPETYGFPLPQNMEDAIRMRTNRKNKGSGGTEQIRL